MTYEWRIFFPLVKPKNQENSKNTDEKIAVDHVFQLEGTPAQTPEKEYGIPPFFGTAVQPGSEKITQREDLYVIIGECEGFGLKYRNKKGLELKSRLATDPQGVETWEKVHLGNSKERNRGDLIKVLGEASFPKANQLGQSIKNMSEDGIKFVTVQKKRWDSVASGVEAEVTLLNISWENQKEKLPPFLSVCLEGSSIKEIHALLETTAIRLWLDRVGMQLDQVLEDPSLYLKPMGYPQFLAQLSK
eukprot:TRINITY_DN13861_c0_g1_i1.p1 TRINITY_DN13861_c0_g1~~TRINITY_DN13861_c0_g1_i1.p1  ORF type:complete len:246 (+),score=64.19 TRINITY_DN13861_c0_g1_i1:108-845(+)